MGLFGKSLEEKTAEAVKSLRGSIKGLKSLDAVVEGKTVTLTGEAESIEAKGKAMAEFNKLVETENTLNKIKLATGARRGRAAARRRRRRDRGRPRADRRRGGPGRREGPRRGEGRHARGDRQEVLRQGGAYMKIFEANKDILTDPDKIKPGQKLRIPD